MTLRTDYTKIKDYKSVCYDAAGNTTPITRAIDLLSVPAGYSEITEENAGEVYRRLAILGELWGAPVHAADGTPVYISEQDVQRHIGFTSNASPLTKRAFDTQAAQERETQAKQ